MSRKLKISVSLAASAAVAAALIGLNAPAQAASSHTLPGSVPTWAKAANRVGATSASQQVTFQVQLAWQGGSAAEDFAHAVSTPGNAAYGKFLTAGQFNAKFAPSAATVTAVKSWLKSQGFKVGEVPANNKYVTATGTVGEAAKAFSTSFANYRFHGKVLRSNTTPLAIPSSLSGVDAVIGLDEAGTLAHPNSNPPPVFNNAPPCSEYWGEATVTNSSTPDDTPLPASPSAFAPCGYAGAQLQGAYGMADAIANGNDGSGVTVAIIDAYASTTMLADANRYSADHGLPSLNGLYSEHVAPGTKKRPENPAQSPEEWSGEQTLDIEAVHTMAPGAKILYVGAPNNYQDMDAALNWVISRHAADIVTNSYGFLGESLPPGYIKPMNDLFVQAAATGISMFFSSGDSGDETFGEPDASPSPDWPASSPWVTAVGGTSLGVDANNDRLFEFGWQTEKSVLDNGAWGDPEYLYGAGGGTSRLFSQPAYQAGVVPGSISQTYGGAAMRAVPDVAALGDPTTGMRVGQTQTWPDGHTAYSEFRLGGTSLASPLYAGMFALATQRAGHGLGFANPLLYSTAGSSANIDITKDGLDTYPGAVRSDYHNGVDDAEGYDYSARWFDRDDSLTIHVRDGYDDVTGIGVPNGEAWLDAVSGS